MIIVRIWEGLGNQLFQYAFAKAYSLKTKKQVKIDTKKIFEKNNTSVYREYSLKHFNISLHEAEDEELQHYSFLEKKSLLQKIVFFLAGHNMNKYCYWEENGGQFAPDIRHFKSNCYVKGWFQSEKYFKYYRSLLLRELTPKKKIVINKELRQILEKDDTVSIHVRRGDYKKYGSMLPLQYYKKAYRRIRDEGDFTYMIFSDDLEWVKDNFGFINKKYLVNEDGRLKDYEELMIMSRCHHNIIANSTFSWWGAWLNVHKDKVVIAPKRWFVQKSVEDDYNMIPQAWTRI